MLPAEMRWEDVEVGSSCHSFCVVSEKGGVAVVSCSQDV